MEKIVKSQEDFDRIKLDFDGMIKIRETKEWIKISARPQAIIYVYDSATIESVSGSATIESVYDSATIKYVYDSATIESVSGLATIESVYDSATIEYVYDSATIKSVSGLATIESVYDSATIKFVYGSATIESVSGSATIKSVYDSATIESVYDSATIESVYGSATIKFVYGYAAINFVSGKAQINCFGFNTVRYFETEKDIRVKASKNTTIVKLKRFDATFSMYKQFYPVTVKGTKVILYKAVHKQGEEYLSDYTRSFKYEIGKTVRHDCEPAEAGSCSVGLHVSHKMWALNFGQWNDMALLECEVPIKELVISEDCDGKVRTGVLKVLREVPKEEYWT